MRTDDTKDDLCASCINGHNYGRQFPECLDTEVEFGDGLGNDNIIKCDNYDPIK